MLNYQRVYYCTSIERIVSGLLWLSPLKLWSFIPSIPHFQNILDDDCVVIWPSEARICFDDLANYTVSNFLLLKNRVFVVEISLNQHAYIPIPQPHLYIISPTTSVLADLYLDLWHVMRQVWLVQQVHQQISPYALMKIVTSPDITL